VLQLSEERGVNHALIDAQARVELSPKKYKAAHDAYLEAVRNGEVAIQPVVHEESQPTPLVPAAMLGAKGKKKRAVGKAKAI
jgi:hypothetical protein